MSRETSQQWTVVTFTERAAARRTTSVELPIRTPLPTGRSLTIGREGDVTIGTEPLDTRIARRALTVEVVDGHWTLRMSNRNGAFVHPWGLRASPLRVSGGDDDP